ncbi:thymidine phosphorylase [Anguilla anguilla]|uniref:thymidine phosphorylase n=1 Tax=Anguilla anguilla TaxID=7936 RepID=UPI0015B2D568|nr:thymidine phosphorylase [Anguilla anguilla]XP_035280341.1 thymidine phosphorylase [Anguilla anguilla]XP_035280342.1 thymidine phosphorylase [Anguilla anguilla]XP_035280343.1 thymidine phosphorylase [Anguilla anguilla]XP_035280344.1 thymidine phosphorylase [Anguilla anguilla]XP_035280345.1 thymidine phosphorylase [Anguilla anguilla]
MENHMENAVSFPELIRKKRDGEQFTSEEIRAFVLAVKNRTIQEAQIGAMLMAIWQKGMVAEETLALTREMMLSGEVLAWPAEWAGLVMDKHSTGGVGDKVSLPLAPALAACGCKVPMISGRALAHTGGTLDKLESIPGFSIDQSVGQMKKILEEVGCCIVGQTENLVPADKVLYAIRDATATVDSMPLVTASIISKKGAESLCALILDVKYGKAAVFKDIASARKMAQSLVAVGNKLGVRTGAALSRMDNPIGLCIGNSLEVLESLECLKGRGPPDLQGLVTCLGGRLLWISGKAPTPESGEQEIGRALADGTALRKFQAMLQAQGVSAENARILCSTDADYFRVLRRAKSEVELEAQAEGTVLEVNAIIIAEVLHKLGAGRTKAGEPINHSVGAELLVTAGMKVKKGDRWARVHFDSRPFGPELQARFQKALVIGSLDCDRAQDTPLVSEFIPPE